jgi:nicotinamidase-related amidase
VPIDLMELVRPAQTVLVTQECQEGILGRDSSLPALAEVAPQRGIVTNIARLVLAARCARVPVVHCTVEKRADGMGANRNARLFVAAQRAPVRMLRGSPAAAVVREIEVDDSDLVLGRLQGLSPMATTELDPVLRNMGCTSIVVVGVSLNVAVTNVVFDAVNRGYQVVVPRDAVAGVPADYAEAVLEHTVSLVATLTTCDALVDAWSATA